jgi:hypothetical protein
LTEEALLEQSKLLGYGCGSLLQDGLGKGNAIEKAIEQIDNQLFTFDLQMKDYTYPTQFLPELIRILEKNPKVTMVCVNVSKIIKKRRR